MKRKNKLALGIVALAATALFASGCTANFATNKEKASIAYALEPGVSEFVVNVPEDHSDIIYDNVVGGNVHQIIRANIDAYDNVLGYKNSALTNDIIASAKKSAVAIPSTDYFAKFDKEAFDLIINKYNAENPEGQIDLSTVTDDALQSCLHDYGYVKFYNEENKQAEEETVGEIAELSKIILTFDLS